MVHVRNFECLELQIYGNALFFLDRFEAWCWMVVHKCGSI